MMEEFEPVENLTRRKSAARDMQARFSQISADLSASQIASRQVKAESDYCPICYTNLIQLGTGAITDDVTFEFKTCKHRFCIECCQEALRLRIDRAEVGKLTCL